SEASDASVRVHHPSLARGSSSTDSSGRIRTSQPLQDVEKRNRSAEDDRNREKELSATEAKEMVDDLNEYMDDLQTHLGFSIREDLNRRVVVEIKNRKSDELIKQIPSEELLKIMESMKELTGIIFDQSV
ncbi:MAG: flagellar protein FlaG, partial [Desulfobacteraceae bacterium]|nr:flagellar protein FlaG [Desulfobacteraceae bacterium]